MVRVKPSKRERKRFLLLQCFVQNTLPKTWGKLFVKEVERVMGLFQASRAGLKCVEFHRDGYAIIRVSHRHVDEVRKTFPYLTTLDGEKIIAVETFSTSGTLRKIRQRLNTIRRT